MYSGVQQSWKNLHNLNLYNIYFIFQVCLCLWCICGMTASELQMKKKTNVSCFKTTLAPAAAAASADSALPYLATILLCFHARPIYKVRFIFYIQSVQNNNNFFASINSIWKTFDLVKTYSTHFCSQSILTTMKHNAWTAFFVVKREKYYLHFCGGILHSHKEAKSHSMDIYTNECNQKWGWIGTRAVLLRSDICFEILKYGPRAIDIHNKIIGW